MSGDDPTSRADFHSHLVPDVDDGARSLEDTLDGVERMTRVGIRKIITTPHLDGSLTREPEAFRLRMAEVDEAWARAREAVAREIPEVDFRRGHEVMLDIPDVDFSDARMRLDGGAMVLVEWPRLQIPPGTAGVIERISKEGWRPIVAHPERYMGMDRELNLADAWRRGGAFLQVNHGSLVGRYGGAARTTAFRLLKRGWVSYLSTDFHARSHLDLHVEEAQAALVEADGEEQWRLLTQTNPGRVFRGEEPLPVPPLPLERGFWSRMRNLFRVEA